MTTTKSLRKYKVCFILDLGNYQNPVETLIEKLTSTIEAIGGSVQKVKNLGQKEYARITDRKCPRGVYIEIDFEGPAESPAKLKEKLKLEKTINRIFIIIHETD